MNKVKIKVKLIFDDWRDRHDMTKSIYNSRTGVELSMGAFHHGSTFEGEIVVSEREAEFLRSAMRDSFCPTFILMDPEVKNWRWI